MDLKPAKKKKTQQSSLTNFFAKDSDPPEAKPPTPSKISAMKPKPKAAPKKAAPKKPAESDDDDIEMDDAPAASKRVDAPRRAARAAPKKYIEINSDEDGDAGGKDDTFEISD